MIMNNLRLILSIDPILTLKQAEIYIFCKKMMFLLRKIYQLFRIHISGEAIELLCIYK